MHSAIPMNAHHIADRLGRFLREDVATWVSQPTKKPLLQQMREAFDLWRTYRFPPYQYFKHDLYLRTVGSEYRNFIPTTVADEYVLDINPAECKPWLEDKLEFERRMKESGLPFFHTFAMFSLKDGIASARNFEGEEIDLRAVWDLAREKNWSAIFVKPRLGYQGLGAFKLDIGAAGFERRGAPISAAELAAMLQATGYDDFMVQPYFEQHPEMSKLYPRSVITLRVMTFVEDGQVTNIATFLRVGSGEAETDNWGTGGYAVNVDLETGAVSATAKLKQSRSENGVALRHPVTGVAFGSIVVPFAAQVLSLVTQGALLFAPLRLIGWDIAIGLDSAWIIEANFLPGFLPVQQVCGGLRDTAFARELAAKLGWR